MERNLDELPRLLRWAIENGIDRFKGHHLWVTWPQLAEQSLRRSQESIVRWNQMVTALREIAAAEPRPDGLRIRLENVEPLSISADPDIGTMTRCPFLGREAWIEADGSFQVCCCPSSQRQDFGEFGNLHETSFMEIWRSPSYRSFISSWGEHSNCLECNMRRPMQEVSNA